MNTTVVHPAPEGVIADAAAPRMPRRISWGAIFAGAVIGLALTVLLTLLGVGIGAATLDPLYDANPGSGLPIGTVVYFAIVQLLSLFVGGYAAARLAGVPLLQGSLLHGAAVWALATFAMVWLGSTAVGALVGGATAMLSKAGQGVAAATEAAVPDDLSVESLSMPNISMESLPPTVREALERQGLTIEQAREEARAAFTSVIGEEERARAADVATDTVKDIASSPTDAGADVDAMLDKLFGGSNAVLSEEDRQQALTEMNERLGLSEEEAQQMIDSAQQQLEQARAEVESAVEEAKMQATEAAQTASDALSGAAFAAFAASLLGLIAAVVGALVGRPKELTREVAEARREGRSV